MNKVEDNGYQIAAFIGMTALISLAVLKGPAFLRARANGMYVTCQHYQKDLGAAMEKYANDNEDKYPVTLEELVPKYIESVPACPASWRNTYSSSYKTSQDKKQFTFFCKGLNHKNVGIRIKNYPQYNSTDGLISRP